MADQCPRCGSADRAKRNYVQPFPGFADEPCQHPWHGRTQDPVQALIQGAHHADTEGEWDPKVEGDMALAVAPMVKDIMDMVKRMLPPGMHFGVYILVPPIEGQREGRLLVGNTDRDVMLPNVAQWVMTMLDHKAKGMR